MSNQQLGLFETAHQRRRPAREPEMVLDAVTVLRKVGHRVYAAGRDHQVDGKLLSSVQLLAMAAAYGAPTK
jgi:hypothetical protein